MILIVETSQDIYMSPMVLALGYGLLFATLLTLVFVPALYMVNMDITKFLSARAASVKSEYTRRFT